jgi:radical SAM superfamily enzyme YgiQ (UPF0313 family)
MKILLISPNIKGFVGGINRIQPPLGLAYLASYLKDKHEVFIRDTAIENYNNKVPLTDNLELIGESDNDIEKYIKKINPDFIGISVLFSNLMHSVKIITNIAKKVNSNIKIAIGGNHITNCILDYQLGIDNLDNIYDQNIDYYFIGESELNFSYFLDTFDMSTQGLCYFQDQKLIINRNNTRLDISNIKDPSWEYFSIEKYFDVGIFHSAQSYSNRILPIMASRGCPEKCSFCSTPLTWGNKVRWKSPFLLYKEMDFFIKKYNIGEIQFQDDTITANLKYLTELCSYLKKFNIPWCTPNGIKINYHQKNQYEMFKMMKESGCYQVTFGCESGSQRVLDEIIQKNTKVSSFKDSIQKAKDAGLFVHSFWIIGFPNETYEEMQKTIDIASKCGADSYSLSIYNPLPGTPLYKEVLDKNLWWDDECSVENMTFRNSLIKVDGFNNPQEFKSFVDSNSYYLNNILRLNDIDRFNKVIENRGVNLRLDDKFIKQT